MKKTAGLLSAGMCLGLLAAAGQEPPLHKKVTVDYRNMAVAEVLKDLGAKAGVEFAYVDKVLETTDNVTYEARNQEAGRVATRILRPRGLRLGKADGRLVAVARLDPLDEFKVKPEPLFEFAEKPKVSRQGDTVTISFATSAFCDVTVAVENADGRILRHLACGVLGENAPEPFLWNSRKQVLVWDGKDDEGNYVDDKNAVTVRVSLGLKAEEGKGLFWSPYKRIGNYPPSICAAPEGVYVFEGRGVDSLRLYDHEGKYLRTLYPFPASKIDQVIGLEKQVVLQTGQALPRKLGYQQATLLSSGDSAIVEDQAMYGDGFAASAMAVHPSASSAGSGQGGRIALAFLRLNRLGTDGTTGGLPLKGPVTGLQLKRAYRTGATYDIGPSSAAFSPDGKTLYLTGYVWKYGLYGEGGTCRHGVYKLDYEKDREPEVFAGKMAEDGEGTDNAHFAVPNSVACDAAGRVYVADYLNDRIQVFDAGGRYLKTIPTTKPARVQIDPRTQEIYAFSWFIRVGISGETFRQYKLDWEKLRQMQPTLTRFGPFDEPKLIHRGTLPLPQAGSGRFMMGQIYGLEIDFWAASPTLWVAARRAEVNPDEVLNWGQGAIERAGKDEGAAWSLALLVQNQGEWAPRRQFAEDARQAVVRVKPPELGIQRLYANEKNHRLYLLEHMSFDKCHDSLLEIDPETGRIRTVKLPFRAEDICFDRHGCIYLRTDREVVRYELESWREIPWDYGEERKGVGFSGQPRADVVSALPLPGARPMWFHQYGMWVSPRGHLAVSCVNREVAPGRDEPGGWKGTVQAGNSRKYEPTIYPGRARHQEIHIWDEHGKLVREDAVPGLGIFNGLGIDKDDNLYVMSQGTRFLSDKAYPNRQTGTVVKFRARGPQWGDVRVLSDTRNTTKRYAPFAPQPLPEAEFPRRPPDTAGRGESGRAWMTGAEWFYGGTGIVGAGCVCWHTRFCIDNFARSFAPEPDLYSVAVVDTAGNLILRAGRYGNVDDPGPALFYPAYVASDTDRRIFVADAGNQRILSLKLGYHAEEKVALKDVPDAGGK